MADYGAIQQLFYRYAYAHNQRDAEALRECFSKDVQLLGASGRDATVAAYEALWESQVNYKRRHIMSNIFIVEESDTEAITMLYWHVFWIKDAKEAIMGGIGRYRDHVVLEDGSWKLFRRQNALDMPYMPGDQRGAETASDFPEPPLTLS